MNKTLKRLFYSIIFILFFCAQIFGQDIIINEFMSSNKSGLQDSKGNYSDWIELYNNSNEAINLLNYSLSDDAKNYQKWIFPNIIIPANGYLLIYASGNDEIYRDELHANFKISQSGEPLILADNEGIVLSLVEPVYVPSDKSFACVHDGSELMVVTDTPTPNSSNNSFTGIQCSHPSGFYKESFNLSLNASNSNLKIYYTLNGETPSVNSKLYTKPISITNNQETPLNISLIPTTPLTGEYQLYDFIWKTPKSVYRCNTIRYGLFRGDTLHGNIYTKTFFVDNKIDNRYTFPIISIVTDSLNLFDYDTGIYIPGKKFDMDGFNWWPSGNYHNSGREWERDVHISYFENNGLLTFETDAGMRMRGYGSASNPQKSFTIYFRKEYGIKNIEYPIFNNPDVEKYKRLIFRNSGQDFIYTHFRDALIQKIIEPMDLDLQGFQPSVVFFNGEYWGIHNIRERYDKYYFKYKYGIHEDDINILGICGGVIEGDNKEYNKLINFISTNDISVSENMDYVTSKLDIDNFIDFQIAEIYFANYDWPCNNFKIWKDNLPESKWRFLIYDLDLSFAYNQHSMHTANSMEHATSNKNSWPYCECSNLIFRKLLQNEDFKKQFLNRFAYCLKNIFEPSRIHSFINEFELLYSPEIEEHIDRWNYPSSIEQWEVEINKLKVFATKRPCYMSKNIISYFDLDSYEYNCFPKDINEIILLYPNPNYGKFKILNNSENDIKGGNVTILNSIGQIVYSQNNISINAGERFHFNLNNTMNGMCIFIFNSTTITEKKKIIIFQ